MTTSLRPTPGERVPAVLVTGASAGIGLKLTESLAHQGTLVYAGVRKESDLRAMSAIKNVHPLHLDVTNRDHIAAAVARVEEAGHGLYGLVNNAGVVTVGRVVDGQETEFDLVMAVNVGGPYHVTRAFAPLIVAEQGRIVTIGSVAGILADSHESVYSMSKHALEAFTDCLATELEQLGVGVCIVEPGGFKTEIFSRALARGGSTSAMPGFDMFPEPDDVVAAVCSALFSANPKRRYLVSTEQTARRVIQKQIEQLAQLNEGHSHGFDRTALIAMLDRELARSSERRTRGIE